MLVKEIIKITGGKLISGGPKIDIDLAAISSDSRAIKKGEFFLPLKGNNFDGEKFIDAALNKGAIGTFWYILQTLYLYLLTLLSFIISSAGVFYPVAALLVLFLLWKVVRRVRRPAY